MREIELLFQKTLVAHNNNKQSSSDYHPPIPLSSSSTATAPTLSQPLPAISQGIYRNGYFGQVRASPFGSCLESHNTVSDAAQFHQWRKEHFPSYHFPMEGFDFIHSNRVIQQNLEYNIQAMAMAYGLSDSKHLYDDDDDEEEPSSHHHHPREYGTFKSTLDAPIGTLKDKWRIIPHFLALRSLLRQHIDSYDYFVNVEMKAIVSSPSAREIRSEHDAKFYLQYTDCWVGEPCIEEDSYSSTPSTPSMCRLRDITYSAPIYVNVRYTRGRQIVIKNKVQIGRIPIMLRSSKCMLYKKSERQLAAMNECPMDPGGYFVIKGVEKVILIQEQLSKNRVIIEEDNKGNPMASITSSTHERKSKAYIISKNGGRVYLKHNIFTEDIPIVIVFKAMGVQSDLEIVQLIGSESDILDCVALSLEEPIRVGILTQSQALNYIGHKIRGKSGLGVSTTDTTSLLNPPSLVPSISVDGTGDGTIRRNGKRNLSAEDEARDVLAHVVLSHIHVPVPQFDFRTKCIYVGHIVRRVLMVHLGKAPIDDKDYYGNKRLELAGNLLSLLFEDVFKLFNNDLKRQADLVLSKPNRAQAFDVIKMIRPDTITQGFVNAIATGNWVLKRFRMDRAGVTQVLSRLSYISALGMMTRVNSQFEKTRKVSGPVRRCMLCHCYVRTTSKLNMNPMNSM